MFLSITTEDVRTMLGELPALAVTPDIEQVRARLERLVHHYFQAHGAVIYEDKQSLQATLRRFVKTAASLARQLDPSARLPPTAGDIGSPARPTFSDVQFLRA